MTDASASPLRRGWTTGACATAATRAAFEALLTGAFPDPVEIVLPRGQRPSFALACEGHGDGWAQAGIIKDAGDDPDVTHGALVMSTVRFGAPGSGVVFVAGEGVGTVTKPGLPLSVGEPAINPVPRQMMTSVIEELSALHDRPGDVVIEISVPGGAKIAEHTWNGRLGIVGGLSILGTTGIVIPYSCSAWIASIHQGINVALAANHRHLAACTGSTSEQAVQQRLGLDDAAMLDMGDFAGAVLKYLRRHPVERLTIGGGFAKLSKLAVGHLDLHSGRSQIDLDYLAERLRYLGAGEEIVSRARVANTALEVLDLARTADLPLASTIATDARVVAVNVIGATPMAIDVLVVDRQGSIVGSSETSQSSATSAAGETSEPSEDP